MTGAGPGAERSWLVRFMSGDTTVAGVFTEAPTFLAALDRCGDLGLIPEGTAALDEEITSPVDERWHDQLLTPAQISEALGGKYMTDLEPGGPYTPERTAEVAETMAEAARYLNVATLDDPANAITSPQNFDRVLASLETMARRMPQLLGQFTAWLRAETETGRTEVTYGSFKGRERMAADMVSIHLEEAAGRFADAARALGEAHQITSAISGVDTGE